MERRLSRQIQDLIDLFLAAADHAEGLQHTLGAKLTELGLAFEQFDDDVAQLLTHLQYMKALAEAYEGDVAENHGVDGSGTA
jgi:hypothetical protein